MSKLLSISIAAYNMEKYLSNAIESCIFSDYLRNRIEIIIVNDGSKDKTLEIAKDYESRYPNCIKVIDKINGGYGSTVNSSISVATGKYFKLLDADDWFNEKGFEKFINRLENCNSDVVFSDYNTVFEDGKIEGTVSFDLESGIVYQISEKHLNAGDYAMHAISVKTNLLKDGNVKLSEKFFFTDTEFVYYSFKWSNTFSYIDENVYQYRLGRNGQSVSKQGMINHVDDAVRVAKKLLDDNNKKSEILDIITSRSVLFAYHALILCGNKGYKKMEELDKEIKGKNFDIYMEIANSKKVYLMRKLKYHFKYFWIFWIKLHTK